MVKRFIVFLLIVAAFIVGMYLLRNVGKPAPEPAVMHEELPQMTPVDTIKALPEPAPVDTTAAPDTLDQF